MERTSWGGAGVEKDKGGRSGGTQKLYRQWYLGGRLKSTKRRQKNKNIITVGGHLVRHKYTLLLCNPWGKHHSITPDNQF